MWNFLKKSAILSAVLLGLAMPSYALAEAKGFTDAHAETSVIGAGKCEGCFNVANPMGNKSHGSGNQWIGPAVNLGLKVLQSQSKKKKKGKASTRRKENGRSAPSKNKVGTAKRKEKAKPVALDYDPKEVQTLLNENGYDVGAIDGSIGPATRRKIKEFQEDHDVPATGQPSKELVILLKTALETTEPQDQPVPINVTKVPDTPQTPDEPEETNQPDEELVELIEDTPHYEMIKVKILTMERLKTENPSQHRIEHASLNGI